MEIDIEKVRKRILNIKKMLESVLTITKDPKRIESIKSSLLLVMKDLKKIDEGTFSLEDLKKYEFSRNLESLDQEEKKISLEILETIPQVSPSSYVVDKDLININSYMSFFEKEYLPLFTPKYLKILFSYQHKLDYFFSEFRRVQMLMSKYVELIENIEKSENEVYISEMQKLRRKRFRELVFNIDRFLKELREFLEMILENPTSEGILLEPHFLIQFQEESKVVNNVEAIEAVKDMYNFVIEFENYLGISG
ncbi:MAG: hypothetical protein ACK4F9_03085 [Brevinematia bacterium]